MTSKSTRREFIKKLSLAVMGGMTTSLICRQAQAKNKSYKILDWTGDNFNAGGHKLRVGGYPKVPKHADSSVDVVILGGGVSGLATAYFLKDRNFLLLEQYGDLGGHCRGSSFKGIDYTYASAYYADDEGYLAELVDELGLVPARLVENKDAWMWDKKFIDDRDSSHTFFKELGRLRSDVMKVSNMVGPRLIDAYRKESYLKNLDRVNMASMLKGYDERFIKLFDSFYRSSLCGNAEEISALSGLYLMEDLFNPTYILPGGNQAIAKALVEKLSVSHKDKLKTNSFVWSVDIREDGASVIYRDNKKRIRKVDTKHVVFNIPHMISARITPNLDTRAKLKLLGFKYGSYLVANLLMNKRIFNQAYDNWFTPPYKFADISLADTPYLLKNMKRDDASVLTVFQPYSFSGPARVILEKGNRKEIANTIVDQVEQVVPELKNVLESVSLSRWGHALAVTRPGYIKTVDELQNLEGKSYSFAHSSAQGLPCVEAAVDAARRVADKLNQKRITANPVYSLSRS